MVEFFHWKVVDLQSKTYMNVILGYVKSRDTVKMKYFFLLEEDRFSASLPRHSLPTKRSKEQNVVRFAEQSFYEKGNSFFKGQKSFVRYFYGCRRSSSKVVKKK